ncbi:MAG: hypothetical protein DLD55_03005 [candidate division SR1 bacterium]|nr:MAG: hypothetical protein DLD55_03005 [candidate division SR1 bacterium]
MGNKLLSYLGKGTLFFSFLAIFAIFSDIIEVIPYFFGMLTSVFTAFFGAFCYIGVSASAISFADTLVSSFAYVLIVLYLYQVFR